MAKKSHLPLGREAQWPDPPSARQWKNGDTKEWAASMLSTLTSWSLSELGKNPGLTEEELIELVYERVPDDVVVSNRDRADGSGIGIGQRTEAQIENDLQKAAEFAIREFNPEVIEQRRQWGKEGGEKSKRPPKYPHELLDDLEGLSAAEQAKLLGVTERTVNRMRARKKRAEAVAAESDG